MWWFPFLLWRFDFYFASAFCAGLNRGLYLNLILSRALCRFPSATEVCPFPLGAPVSGIACSLFGLSLPCFIIRDADANLCTDACVQDSVCISIREPSKVARHPRSLPANRLKISGEAACHRRSRPEAIHSPPCPSPAFDLQPVVEVVGVHTRIEVMGALLADVNFENLLVWAGRIDHGRGYGSFATYPCRS